MIAFRTITYFLVTSLLSATVGLVLVVAIQPGKLEGLKATLGNGKHSINPLKSFISWKLSTM